MTNIDNYGKWFVLTIVILLSGLVFLDQTILPVALPTIQYQFASSEVQLQWMVNSYLLTLAILALGGGRIADIYGYKRVLLIGIIIFIFGSLICGFSFSSYSLIFGRVVLGIGGAFLLPASLPILFSVFPKEKHGMAMGLQVSIGSLFMVLGPFISGIFTQYLSWKYGFLINIPICLIALILTIIFVPNFEKNNDKIDYLGFLSYSIAIFSLAYAFMQASKYGLFSYKILILILTGIVFLFLLYYSEKRSKRSFIDFSIFKNKEFVVSVINIFCMGFALMITVYWSIYMQKIMGFSAFNAGSYNMIGSIPILFMASISGHLYDRFGFRVPVTIGQFVLLLSFIWIVFLLPYNNIYLVIVGFFLMTAGFTMVISSSFTKGITSVLPSKKGIANGVLTTFRSLGPVFGVAILGSVFSNFQYYLFSKELLHNDNTKHLDPMSFEGFLAKTDKSMQAFNELSHSVQKYVIDNLMSSSMKAFIAANILLVVLVFISFIMTRKLKNSN